MDTKELFEKLYFHELERKEQIIARLQLPLAMIVTIAGFLGYLIGLFEIRADNYLESLFWISLVVSMFFLGLATVYFLRALWTNLYSLLPTAKESDEYLSEMRELYKPYRRGKRIAKKHFQNYIYSCLRDCSSENSAVNDVRLGHLNRAIASIVPTVFFSLMAYCIFVLGGLEKTKIDQIHKVSIQAPTTKELMKMPKKEDSKKPTNEAPPPPPPPPPRLLREDAPPKYQPSKSK